MAAGWRRGQAHLLEKDIWVVWTLSAIFASPLGDTLTFKGGASLSTAYKVIDCFSNYIDLTNTSANWCWTCCAMAISFWRHRVWRKDPPISVYPFPGGLRLIQLSRRLRSR
ncbi:MAG: nucleotidyl transferase AbiEii/AbiGii toxin family protein [Alphaproteobacteria bacterium]|nr:nucleotidyl transferase AbiEii/AbiGii toxin family protein [Alphaproteobacteria bacterium]